MQIYHYSPSNGAFLGSGIADESPLEPGVYLIPAYSTEISPPVPGEGQYASWNGESWEIKAEEQPDPETVTTVPVSVTPRQGLIMLSRAGILSDVNAAIAAIEGQAGEEARIDFERANEWRRDWPLINNLAAGMGLTSQQIDELFIAAAEI